MGLRSVFSEMSEKLINYQFDYYYLDNNDGHGKHISEIII